MENKVDFHMHTYYSDGQMKPTELVKKMKNEKYDMIAITDHDSVDGIGEALIAGEALEIVVIPGIELSTRLNRTLDMHILGYNIDKENLELTETLTKLREIRKNRNLKLINKLGELGYPITYEDIKDRPNQDYFGKPNFARALVKKGLVKDYDSAADIVFNNKEIKAIKKEKLDTLVAIELILHAGGIPVLAHPGKIHVEGQRGSEEWQSNLEQLIRELKKAGLKGIECFHPAHSEKESGFFVRMAGKYHLHITEGSDFHGDK